MDNIYTTKRTAFAKREREDEARRGNTGGLAPAGYANALLYGSPSAVPDGKTKYAAMEAFLLVAGGTPLRQACKEIGNGLTGKPLSPAALWRIVTDPYYAGYTVTPDGEWVKAKHEALVPLSLFNRAQTQLAKRRRNPGRTISA